MPRVNRVQGTPRKFNFGEEVRTPLGSGKIIGISRRSDGWTYETDADDPDNDNPDNWWREEVLSRIEKDT